MTSIVIDLKNRPMWEYERPRVLMGKQVAGNQMTGNIEMDMTQSTDDQSCYFESVLTDESAALLAPVHVSAMASELTADDPTHAYVKRAKILIVDDEPLTIKLARKYLRGIGYENTIDTMNSMEVLDMIRREHPDLVLLDIVMPEMDGLDILREIRADDQLKMLPVVILTAFCDAETRRNALDAGATDFLGKPVDPHELAPRVRNALVVKAHQDRLAQRANQLQCEVRDQAEALVTARHEAELRYVAGKAAIATDVLHNVGNALNSVNVGVNLVALTVRDSKIQSLRRAAELLAQHESDLARFLTQRRTRSHPPLIPARSCRRAGPGTRPNDEGD